MYRCVCVGMGVKSHNPFLLTHQLHPTRPTAQTRTHRYYGKSQPLRPFTARRMDYLSSEQALADYSELVTALKAQLAAPDSPVIAFGGSYGGMLAAWWRVAYPHIVTGAVAASAPVLDFEGEVDDAAVESFAQIVTRDASAEGGASPYCAVCAYIVYSWGPLASSDDLRLTCTL